MSGFSFTFKDANGEYSSKRVAAFSALGLYALGFTASTFTHYTPPEYQMHDLMIMSLGGLGMALAEWFSPGGKAPPAEEKK